MELNIPRDRNNEFEPQIIPKYQREITGIEGQIIALYASGMCNHLTHSNLFRYISSSFLVILSTFSSSKLNCLYNPEP